MRKSKKKSRKKSRSRTIRPKKRLGQNFLTNKAVSDRIISSCDLQPSDIVLEIGPGTGVLTREIARHVKHVIAIEIDKTLCQALIKEFDDSNVTVMQGDILSYDFGLLPKNLKVIGNLPYYISSPIIDRLVASRGSISSIFVTVQLEFGKRMIANINTRDYSALSLFVQYYMQSKMLFQIKNSCFRPIPKVHSCFMRLDILKTPLLKAEDESLLWMIVHHAFQQRRKVIKNSLSQFVERRDLCALLDSLIIDKKLRAENLTLKDFVAIANAFYAAGHTHD